MTVVMSTTKNHTDTYASGDERTDEPELSADDEFTFPRITVAAPRFITSTARMNRSKCVTSQSESRCGKTIRRFKPSPRKIVNVHIFRCTSPTSRNSTRRVHRVRTSARHRRPPSRHGWNHTSCRSEPGYRTERRGLRVGYVLPRCPFPRIDSFRRAAFRLPFSSLVPLLVVTTVLLTALLAVSVDRFVSV